MRRKPDGWNIVLAGIWNRAIFTPEWVNRNLFHQQEVETLISIMPYLPIVYRNEQVAVEVATPRLVFRPRILDDVCILAAEEMAHIVLNSLQDTPLLGLGINFAFVESTPRPALVESFDFADNGVLAEVGWGIQERRIVRRMQRGIDTLNLTLLFDGQDITVEFNFHADTPDNQAARNAVNQRVIGLRDAAMQILSDVYHLQVQNGDDQHE